MNGIDGINGIDDSDGTGTTTGIEFDDIGSTDGTNNNRTNKNSTEIVDDSRIEIYRNTIINVGIDNSKIEIYRDKFIAVETYDVV